MIHKLIVAVSALLALSVAAAAADEPLHPKLKASAIVTGDIVRIGDLVENAGIVAKVPIFRAPDLGYSGTVSTEAVVEAVRPHALLGLDTGGIEDVIVTRASRTIEPQTIESAVTTALAAQYALGEARNVTLTLDRTLGPVAVEPTAKGDARVIHATFDPHTGLFASTIEIPGRAPFRITGSAQVTVQVATVAHVIARGETIKHADVVMARLPRAGVGRDIITDANQAIGLAARNGLQPGQILRTAELMKPDIVQRNEMITLIYEVPGITLTVRGKAVDGGAEGDTIGVLNEQSKRVVQGVIIAPGRVVIAGNAPKLAANLPPAGDPPAGKAR